MRPKKKSFNPFVVFTLLCLGGIIATNLFPIPCWGSEIQSEPAVFSLDVKDEPLKVVLGKITKLTGYTIRVNEKWADLRITASMQNVTIEEAFKKIFVNYALIIQNTQKNISIFICGPMQSSNGNQVSLSLKKGEKAPGYLPYDKEGSRAMEIDPGDMEVIPPDKPGERGITQREIDAIRAQQEKIDPLDIEVIPPAEPGGKGITQRELDAMRAQQEKIDPLDIEIIPPAEPGGKGITQREINAMKSKGIESHTMQN